MVIPGGVTDLCTSSFGDMHMSDQLTLSAEARERAGKGASRDLRRNGRVPAVIYGDNQEPVMIPVEEKALNKLLGTGYFMNSVVMVDVGGKAARTLTKDVAFHTVTEIGGASGRERGGK